MNQKTAFTFLAALTVLLHSCSRELEVPDNTGTNEPAALAALQPAAKGKYITYRLDSIVTILQGQALETRRYQVKDVWDSLLTDNLGQPAWRVYRFINDSLARGTWRPLTTYTVTVLPDRVEQYEQNLRTIRLQLPISADVTWRGNRHLVYGAYGLFNNTGFADVNKWVFGYTGKKPEQIGGKNINDVWTVTHFNEVADTLNMPDKQTRLWGIGLSEDKYAPGIGLVARQLLLIEHNPNRIDATTYKPYKSGFGIRMWMIDHN